jgi:hypothetical protein
MKQGHDQPAAILSDARGDVDGKSKHDRVEKEC